MVLDIISKSFDMSYMCIFIHIEEGVISPPSPAIPRAFYAATRVFAKKNIQPIIPSNLKKAKIIRASL